MKPKVTQVSASATVPPKPKPVKKRRITRKRSQ
jgi:hypothetical protein